MGGLLHLVYSEKGLQPAQVPSRCTKCNNPPINGQCTNCVLPLEYVARMCYGKARESVKLIQQTEFHLKIALSFF